MSLVIHLPMVCINLIHELIDSRSVLPPISTSGMSHKDVAALAIRVRELMVEALREISVPSPDPAAPTPSPPSQSSDDLLSDTATLEKPKVADPPKIAAPAPFAAANVVPAQLAIPGSRSDSRASTNPSDDFSSPPSSISHHSREEGSEAGAETEEDEGMVLVGRPSQS